jgi:hypothetical protein
MESGGWVAFWGRFFRRVASHGGIRWGTKAGRGRETRGRGEVRRTDAFVDAHSLPFSQRRGRC